SDLIKPIYYGHNNENIKEFFEDYKTYSALKACDNDKKQQYIQELIKPFRERVEMQYSETYKDTKKQNIVKSDIDDLITAFDTLKFYCFGQNQDPDNQIDKIESSIKELTKAIQDLKETREPTIYHDQRGKLKP
ncbi:15572_t:CDS:2, partial [Cetraspora pellucida]